jgi:hypothetical protein
MRGRSNKEIGATLGIEVRTLKAYVAKLLRKIGVQNRIVLSVHTVALSGETRGKESADLPGTNQPLIAQCQPK